jgi:dTDP-4-dehydrorhamnose reductase
LNFDIKYSLFENIFFWEWLSDKKIKKFINVSSVKIFNPYNNEIISALSFQNPISPYGMAKTLSESYFTNLFDPTKVMNVRLSSVAAVGEHPSHLISQLYQSAFLNKKIKIYTGIKSYVMYIQEAIDLIIACALYGKEEKYNLGGKGYFNECIVSKFEKISNKKTITEFINVLPTLPEIKYKFDNNKFPQKFIRRFSLEKLLTDYIENRLLLDL